MAVVIVADEPVQISEGVRNAYITSNAEFMYSFGNESDTWHTYYTFKEALELSAEYGCVWAKSFSGKPVCINVSVAVS